MTPYRKYLFYVIHWNGGMPLDALKEFVRARPTSELEQIAMRVLGQRARLRFR